MGNHTSKVFCTLVKQLQWTRQQQGSNQHYTVQSHQKFTHNFRERLNPPKLNYHCVEGEKKKRKRKESNSRFFCQLKRGTPTSATKHLSHIPNNNICFCPINCFHMGETPHLVILLSEVSFQGTQRSTPNVMPPSVSSSGWHWQICRNCTVRFPARMISQRDEKMCWVTEQYRQWTHHWVLAKGQVCPFDVPRG